MDRPSVTQSVFALLVMTIVFVMPTQWSFECFSSHLTLADILLLIAFILWIVWRVMGSGQSKVTCPPLASLALVVVIVLSVTYANNRSAAVRETIQWIEYLLVGYLVFANCIRSEGHLRSVINVFLLITSAIAVYALWQYFTVDNAMDVRGTFGNRNVLGSFFAIALPFAFSFSLHEKGLMARLSLWLAVFVGCLTTLSGGSLLAIVVAILAISAIRGQKVLLPVLIVLGLSVLFLPVGLKHLRGWVPQNHGNILVDSVSIHPDGSSLLKTAKVILKAKELHSEGNYQTADTLLKTIPTDAIDDEVASAMTEVRQALDENGIAPGPTPPEIAARYKGWYAAVSLLQKNPRALVRGVGGGNYQEEVNREYGSGALAKPSGRVDLAPFFNLHADEPDSFSQYIVIAVEYGLLGILALAWWLHVFLGKAVRSLGHEKNKLGSTIALGVLGSLIGFAVNGVFSSGLVRGVALPIVFILAMVAVTEREPSSKQS